MALNSYVFDFSHEARMRVRIRTEKARVKGFTVQVEARSGEKWTPVTRYDAAHGKAHVHFYARDGRHTRETLDLELAEAATYAINEIKTTWRTQCRAFKEGRWP